MRSTWLTECNADASRDVPCSFTEQLGRGKTQILSSPTCATEWMLHTLYQSTGSNYFMHKVVAAIQELNFEESRASSTGVAPPLPSPSVRAQRASGSFNRKFVFFVIERSFGQILNYRNW